VNNEMHATGPINKREGASQVTAEWYEKEHKIKGTHTHTHTQVTQVAKNQANFMANPQSTVNSLQRTN